MTADELSRGTSRERSESAVKEVPLSGDRNRHSRSKSPKPRWHHGDDSAASASSSLSNMNTIGEVTATGETVAAAESTIPSAAAPAETVSVIKEDSAVALDSSTNGGSKDKQRKRKYLTIEAQVAGILGSGNNNNNNGAKKPTTVVTRRDVNTNDVDVKEERDEEEGGESDEKENIGGRVVDMENITITAVVSDGSNVQRKVVDSAAVVETIEPVDETAAFTKQSSRTVIIEVGLKWLKWIS
jgi:hypothetical protein